VRRAAEIFRQSWKRRVVEFAASLWQAHGRDGTHDPTLIRDPAGGAWYVFSTGDPLVAAGTIQVRRSTDLHNWTFAGTVFTAIPAWVIRAVPGVTSVADHSTAH